ncbi:MAG TPA: DoxX family protein [Pseudonocardiaceae bacterium]|nr:DoxX family protein [Pseudonocardiaceae bacterium]
MTRMPSIVREVALLVGRLTIGAIFIVHGWTKLFSTGMDATVSMFTAVGVPLPELAAWFAAFAELLGGLALVLGVALPLAAILVSVVTLGALIFVHAKNGFFVQTGGFEFVLALTAATLALGFNGGSYALSQVIGRNK